MNDDMGVSDGLAVFEGLAAQADALVQRLEAAGPQLDELRDSDFPGAHYLYDVLYYDARGQLGRLAEALRLLAAGAGDDGRWFYEFYVRARGVAAEEGLREAEAGSNAAGSSLRAFLAANDLGDAR